MVKIDPDTVADRFMRYVRIDTQADPDSETSPSSEKQKDLGGLLAKELCAMGIKDAELDEFGYVYATLPANTAKTGVPTICLCAHVDTAPDCSGTDVKPILHRNYDGKDIVLPDDPAQVLRVSDLPYLKDHIGHDIITASGLTLLGADDKAGIAVIMTAVEYLLQNPSIPHGAIKIVFTPDEEVGKGTAKIDMAKIGASYGYTLDGGDAGELEDETFNADAATITINGIIVHPGAAKGKLINALKIAGAVFIALPKDEWSPETTSDREGFVHPVAVDGNAEQATIRFIVRDFDLDGLAAHHARLQKIAEDVTARFPGASMAYDSKKQYRNMKDVVDRHPQIIANAEEAIARAGLNVIRRSIRGGTDGSNLSHLGMPCPNLFTGMQTIHSKLEWIGVSDMVKSVETLIHLAMVWEERA